MICSPNAARSQYVNEEIRRYKALGRGDRVIPIIVDGEPGDPERECFPPALRFKIGADGALTDEHEEPIAADARPQGDGKEVAKLKLVAGLLGVGLDEIVRRAERARRQRLRNWVGALALLTLTFAGLAVWAEINRQEAERQRKNAVTSLNAATRTSNDLIYDLALRFRNQMGVPSALVRDILARAQKLQGELTASGQNVSPTSGTARPRFFRKRPSRCCRSATGRARSMPRIVRGKSSKIWWPRVRTMSRCRWISASPTSADRRYFRRLGADR